MTFAITGIGLVTPAGDSPDEFWDSVAGGRTVLAPIARFDPSPYSFALAGEIKEYANEQVADRVIPQTDVWTRHGLTQAARALADAEIDAAELPEYRLGVSLASSAGGVEFGQREIESLWARGPQYVGAYQSIAWFYAATTGQTSIAHGLRGQCDSVVTEAAGAIDSAQIADRSLRRDSDVVLFGGSDSALSPYGMVCQSASGRLSESSDPRGAYLPFDERACGYVTGEGGAILVAESAESAARRSARRYGWVRGVCSTFDATSDDDEIGPAGLVAAMTGALSRAGIRPSEVDVVFADGGGTRALDAAEAAAIANVFGERGVPVTVPKAGYGRLYSGGAAVDLVTACLSFRAQAVPPTPNVTRQWLQARIDLVTEYRSQPVDVALVLARGYGGFNSALVVSVDQ